MAYFGIYCEQCGVWMRKRSDDLFFYPSAEIAEADIADQSLQSPYITQHLWRAQEFGKEKVVHQTELPPDATLCPILLQNKWQAEANMRRAHG